MKKILILLCLTAIANAGIDKPWEGKSKEYTIELWKKAPSVVQYIDKNMRKGTTVVVENTWGLIEGISSSPRDTAYQMMTISMTKFPSLKSWIAEIARQMLHLISTHKTFLSETNEKDAEAYYNDASRASVASESNVTPASLEFSTEDQDKTAATRLNSNINRLKSVMSASSSSSPTDPDVVKVREIQTSPLTKLFVQDLADISKGRSPVISSSVATNTSDEVKRLTEELKGQVTQILALEQGQFVTLSRASRGSDMWMIESDESHGSCKYEVFRTDGSAKSILFRLSSSSTRLEMQSFQANSFEELSAMLSPAENKEKHTEAHTKRLEEELTQLRAESPGKLGETERQLKEREEIRKELENTRKKLERAQEEVKRASQEATDERKSLQKRVAALRSELERRLKDTLILEKAKKELESESAKLLSKVEKVEKQNEIALATITRREKEFAGRLEEKDEELQCVEEELESARLKILETKEERESEFNDLSVMLQANEEGFNAKETEIRELLAANGILREDLEEAKEEVEKARKAKEEAESEFKDTFDELQSYESDLDRKGDEIQMLARKLEVAEGKAERAKEELERVKEEAKEQKEEAEKGKEEIKKELQEENEKLSKVIDTIREMLSSAVKSKKDDHWYEISDQIGINLYKLLNPAEDKK